MANDVWASKAQIESPAENAFAITPNNSVDLATNTRAIYIGGNGNISLITVGGNTVTFVGLLAGTLLPIRASRVNSTSTTATNLVGLY